MTRVFAAADIGSNTAHLLVAATDGKLVMRIDNCNEWIPLGEEVARLGEIRDERADDLVAAVAEFKRIATEEQATDLYVFATEAMRIARNRDEVVARIERETGVQISVIEPRREADLGFRGVGLDTHDVGANVMIEVGGGSAQIATVAEGVVVDDVSLPLGTGRLIAEAGLVNPCPPSALAKADRFINETLAGCAIDVRAPVAVASGGVVRGLWRALHPDSEKTLALEELDYIVWAASQLAAVRIQTRFNVKAKRAGTLLPGALVYRAIMRKFGLQHVAISEFGVREGAILEMADSRAKVGGA